MMKTGLLFGSFNPIHNGHIAIAEFMADKTDLDEVWLVISPQNPLKKENDLLDQTIRLNLAKIAIQGHAKLKVCDVEFNLPLPSYTINTLSFLKKKYPENTFVLIVGEDNLRNFHLWKEHNKILSEFELYVYPRKITKSENTGTDIVHPNIKKFDLPLLDISATKIRETIKAGKNVSLLMPTKVFEEIQNKKYFR